MGREPGLKRFKISPSNDRFLIAETSSGIITIRTKKKKRNIPENWRFKKFNNGERSSKNWEKERKKERRNFHGTTIWTSIDRVPFPGEISARVWRRVSWVEVEWLRGKTRTGKSYALWFAVHSPLPPSTANLITSLVARDPVTLPLPSKPRVERKTIAPLSPTQPLAQTRNVPSEGWSGRPPVLWISFISDEHLARHNENTFSSNVLRQLVPMDPTMTCARLVRGFVPSKLWWFVRSKGEGRG